MVHVYSCFHLVHLLGENETPSEEDDGWWRQIENETASGEDDGWWRQIENETASEESQTLTTN